MTRMVDRQQVDALVDWHEQRAKLSQYEEDARAHEATATMLRDLWAGLATAVDAVLEAEEASLPRAPAKPSARARKRAH